MTFRHGTAIAGGLVALTLLLAACGGGDPSGTAAGSAASKADFVAKGSALCAKATRATASVTASGLAGEAKEITSAYVSLADELEGMGVPQGPGYSKFIASVEAMGRVERKARAAAVQGNEEELGALASELGPLVEAFEKRAKVVGLKHCG